MNEIKAFEDLERVSPQLKTHERYTFTWKSVKSPLVLCGFAVELDEERAVYPPVGSTLLSSYPDYVSEVDAVLWTKAAVEGLYIGRIVAFKAEMTTQWIPLAFVLDFPRLVVPPGIEMRLGIVSNAQNLLRVKVTPKGYLYEPKREH